MLKRHPPAGPEGGPGWLRGAVVVRDRPGPRERRRGPGRGAEGVKASEAAGAGLAGRARGPLLTGASGAETETRPRPWAGARGGGEAAWRGRGGPGGRAGRAGRAAPESRRVGEGAPAPTPLARENVGDLLEAGGLQVEEGALFVLQLLPGR